MHQKERVAFNIRKWLNYEWNRVAKNKNNNMKRIFDKRSMRLYTPKSEFGRMCTTAAPSLSTSQLAFS